MKISSALRNDFGIGGTIRTTHNLARQHDVEIASVPGQRDEPVFQRNPCVRLRHLAEVHGDGPGYDGDAADRAPARAFPCGSGRHGQASALTDRRMAEHLSTVEVMRSGLPVVSTDCPPGPGEIAENGVDGLLVQVGNVGAVAEGLLELINDKALQHRMAGEVLKDSERFDPAGIAECCEPIAAAPQAADFFNTMVRWEAP
ncbi:glycosyltransferase [Streptomyces vastus]|uniref:Glycosyl transferase family 1 domain-containing protein n=1 Tax=Streptomyces vastus TaxID=285451 RepID=A0ABN3RIS0_9ACTN